MLKFRVTMSKFGVNFFLHMALIRFPSVLNPRWDISGVQYNNVTLFSACEQSYTFVPNNPCPKFHFLHTYLQFPAYAWYIIGIKHHRCRCSLIWMCIQIKSSTSLCIEHLCTLFRDICCASKYNWCISTSCMLTTLVLAQSCHYKIVSMAYWRMNNTISDDGAAIE